MGKQKLNVLVIFEKPPAEEFSLKKHLYLKDWENEKDVIHTLQSLGHRVICHGIHNEVQSFIKIVKEENPDVVFNLCETFNEDRNYESNLSSLCELLDVPYTGADPFSLTLCKDKALQKKIVAYHKINIPKFAVIKDRKDFKCLSDFSFPAIVKLLKYEASEGISASSYVRNNKACLERVSYLLDKYQDAVIVEEFIEGREVYVSLIGSKNIQVYPPVELAFKNYPRNKPNLATYTAKWDNNYRKKWGLEVSPWKLCSSQTKKLSDYCKKIFRALNLSGYVRFDLRVCHSGEIFFIEANPNPAIARSDEFSQSMIFSGITYENIIQEIIDHSLQKK